MFAYMVAVQSSTLVLTSFVSLALLGCGPQTGTTLDPIAPQTAIVGTELGVMLRAANTNAVDFKFDSDIDLHSRRVKPTLTEYANGEAMFRWTPLASDLGDHSFHFTAVVGGVATSELVAIRVVSGSDPISFRSPVGEGTTLDLLRAPCVIVPLLIDDTSATEVDLQSGKALPEGATLSRSGPLAGQLKFCPSKMLAEQQTIFQFVIVASDGGGARTEKRYTVVLGMLAPPVVTPDPGPNPNPNPNPDPMPMEMCDTAAPTVVTTPHPDITTASNPHIDAEISDPHGVYNAVVFWSTTAPADAMNPDLLAMNTASTWSF